MPAADAMLRDVCEGAHACFKVSPEGGSPEDYAATNATTSVVTKVCAK